MATIHKAELASGPSGAVEYGDEIDFAKAVDRRKNKLNVVVRGSEHKENRKLAGEIEAAIGPCERDDPHVSAGPLALPHYHQKARLADGGHCFYETTRRKAKKKSK